MKPLTKEEFREKVLADQRKRKDIEKQKKTILDGYIIDHMYKNRKKGRRYHRKDN